MGSDSASVVDERLRVRGVTGLRVIDASVISNAALVFAGCAPTVAMAPNSPATTIIIARIVTVLPEEKKASA